MSNISRVTGASIGTMSVVKQETKNPPAGWYEGVELLDYWLRHTGENPPRVGDHIDTGDDMGIEDENYKTALNKAISMGFGGTSENP